jgi:ABC-type lipoprotein release transport system permease subunit
MILKLAYRNLIGAGLRTWLNVIVLSIAFVTIVLIQGLLEGMNKQIADAVTEAEYAGGHYWHQNYDPYDPFTLQDAHGVIPAEFRELIQQNLATAILIVRGSIYPGGRIQPVLIKGIEPQQQILSIPAYFLDQSDADLPLLIGNRMAKSSGLKIGDLVTLQWRDVHGAIDAREGTIVQIMNTSVPTIDNGQIWMPLAQLQQLTDMPDQATMIIMKQNYSQPEYVAGWIYRDLNYLLQDVNEMIESKSVSSGLFFLILLFLAMLAIFDTQVLSIFRRRKEMGTLMAMGLTRFQLINLFTLEGAFNGVMAAMLGAIYGFPLFRFLARSGIELPQIADSYGFALGEKLFPAYSIGLVIGTTLLVLIITTIVSFLPTRRIARLKPTDALRGKMT